MSFPKDKLNLKSAMSLALIGISACLFLAPKQDAVATNRTASVVAERTTVNSEFLIAQQNRTRRIQFARGTSSAVVEDAVVRGTRDTYLLGARARQRMTVSISSVEQNAVFDVVAPNGRVIKQEATSFSGALPATGDYRIVVGGTRGNATYKLQVSIR
ncbi:MAG TPA: hypothetical protein V6D28_10965 [Leptolyngbyaceae cyanobacterium]